MSDYGSNYVTSERNRRWLPSKPWNRQPLSPTIPIAKLKLYRDLALRVLSKSLTELPSHYYYRHLSNNSSSALSSRPPSSISAYRPSSVVSHSSSAPMDRVTLSYPGTPTKSYGYIQHQQQQQHLATLASSYGRPSSVNLHTHPSSRYSPDPYLQPVIGGGSSSWTQRQSSSYSDRHYPISPSIIARRNVTLPVTHNHPSSSSVTSRSSALPGLTLSRRSPEPYGTTTNIGGEVSLREQIKNGLKYFADERKRLHQQQQQQQQQQYNDNLYHSDHDLRYIQTNLSSPYNLNPLPVGSSSYGGQGSVVMTPSITGQSILRSQGMISGYPRSRQHRSESDLDALFNLYSHVPDPVIERRPLPGVSRVGGIPYTDMSPLPLQNSTNPYLQRNASFPSIPLPGSTGYYNAYGQPHHGQVQPHINQPQASSYYNQHHLHPSYQQQQQQLLLQQQQHLQSIEQQRYAQSNPCTIYPGYGSTATATTQNRYSRSLDRYYN